MKTEIYNIDGMSCAACSSAVERVTRRLEGVQESNVNLTTAKMTITYDEAMVTQEMIEEKVDKAGFKALLVPDAPSNMIYFFVRFTDEQMLSYINENRTEILSQYTGGSLEEDMTTYGEALSITFDEEKLSVLSIEDIVIDTGDDEE